MRRGCMVMVLTRLRRLRLSLAGVTSASAGVLYMSVLVFVSLTDRLGKALALTCAGILALAGVAMLQMWMSRRYGLSQAVGVNALVGVLVSAILTADGLLVHPGLAKDVNPSLGGVLVHLMRLLLGLALPGMAISTAVYLLIGRVRRHASHVSQE